MSVRTLLLAVFSSAVLAGAPHAQTLTGSISGVVVSADQPDQSIRRAIVMLTVRNTVTSTSSMPQRWCTMARPAVTTRWSSPAIG